MLNLATILSESAARYPAKAAFVYQDAALSYVEINERANQVANALVAIGIKPGDKVAMTCPNIPAFPVLYFGIIKMGATVVPLSLLLKRDEIAYQLTNCDAKAYFCFCGTKELPAGEMGYDAFNCVAGTEHFFMIMPDDAMPSNIAATQTFGDLVAGQPLHFENYESNADDTCLIIYTSGTTGYPKGAELTHSNLFFNALVSTEVMENTPEDVLLVVLPLFHIFGMTVMMNAGVLKGNTHVLISRFDPEVVFNTMIKHDVTLFSGVPTMYSALLNYTNPTIDYTQITKQLKRCISGGGPLPLKVLEDFEKRFSLQILEGYGMSEGSPVVSFNQSHVGTKPGSIGTKVWGVDVKLVDAECNEVGPNVKGELLFKGHNVMKGYYNNPEETKKAIKNGWMHSGDIAIKDEDGFFFIVDRIKDMIVRGGMKVYPREVEEVMMKHEAIALVAVIGIPHRELGEEVKAFVVLKKDQAVSGKDLIEWTKERIASYKYPRQVEVLTAMPMTATGKILKKELRK